MPDPNIVLITLVAAGLWYGGLGVVHGAKKAGHAIARVLKNGVHPHK